MIAYFDTSAIVPLIAEEPATAVCWDAFSTSDEAITATVAYVEATAALARAHAGGRLGRMSVTGTVKRLDGVFQYFTLVDVGGDVVRAAASLAWRQPLRGYDAVHCATALQFAGEEFVAVSGDRQLLTAWQSFGITTIDTNSN